MSEVAPVVPPVVSVMIPQGVQMQQQGAQPQQSGSLSLYVGNLGQDVVEANLYDKFGAIGPITSVRVCRDSTTRRSLGYAYVNFVNADDAKRAIEQFNYDTIGNSTNPIRVMYSQRDPNLRRTGLGNIFISNLEKSIDVKTLNDTFAVFGNILSCKVSVDPKTNQSRGYGFVHFASEQEANQAIARLNNALVQGQPIRVFAYKSKQERQKERENSFTNVFIKNIPLSWDESKLNELFGQFGTIKRSTIRKKEGTNDSKGYGFVEFEDHESARNAVEKLNNHLVEEGRPGLTVERAQKKSERMEMLRNGTLRNQARRPEGENLYVKNLSESVTEDHLRKLFTQCGNVKNVKVMVDQTGRPRGFGFVSFHTQEEATKAVTDINGTFLEGKPLYVAKFLRSEERKQQVQMFLSIRQQQQMAAQYGMPYPPYMVPMPQYPPYMRPPRPAGMGQQARFGAPGPAQFRPPVMPMMPMMSRPGMRPTSMPMQLNNPMPIRRPAPNPRRQDPVNASTLAAMTERDQKTYIGDRLYPLINERHGEKAGKITGMLLEMDNSELLHLLEDPQALMAKEQEALRVLQEHARGAMP